MPVACVYDSLLVYVRVVAGCLCLWTISCRLLMSMTSCRLLVLMDD